MLIVFMTTGPSLLMCLLGAKEKSLRFKEIRNQRTLAGISPFLFTRSLRDNFGFLRRRPTRILVLLVLSSEDLSLS